MEVSFVMSLVFKKRFEGCLGLEWYYFDNIHINGSLVDEHPAISQDSVIEDVKIFQNVSEEDRRTRGMDIYCNTAIKLFFSVFSCIFDNKTVITDRIIIESTTDENGNTKYFVQANIH